MYLLSYIRGDFVYCPVLLVLFRFPGAGVLCVMGLYGFFCGKTRRELFGDAAEQAADIFDADGCKHAEKRNVGV